MKKIITIIIVAIISLGILNVLVEQFEIFLYEKELENLKKQPFTLTENFTYTAHTGCVGTPDNSLEAIKIGAKYGVDIVEFDLYFTKNDEPVLSHDEPVGNEFTLDQAFKKVSEYESLKANVDLKSYGSLEKVVECAEKYGIKDRIFFTGIFLKDVEAVKKACPDIEYYLNYEIEKGRKQTDEYLENLVKTVKDSGAIGINCSYKNVTEKMVKAFRENGLLVSVWTVNDEKDMYKVLQLQPDNITTRNPDILGDIVK